MVCSNGSIPQATLELNFLGPISKEVHFWGKRAVSKGRAC